LKKSAASHCTGCLSPVIETSGPLITSLAFSKGNASWMSSRIGQATSQPFFFIDAFGRATRGKSERSSRWLISEVIKMPATMAGYRFTAPLTFDGKHVSRHCFPDWPARRRFVDRAFQNVRTTYPAVGTSLICTVMLSRSAAIESSPLKAWVATPFALAKNASQHHVCSPIW